MTLLWIAKGLDRSANRVRIWDRRLGEWSWKNSLLRDCVFILILFYAIVITVYMFGHFWYGGLTIDGRP